MEVGITDRPWETADLVALLEAEERTRLILESTDEGIFGVDTEGRISFVNPATCRMLGFTAGGTCLLAVMGVVSYVFVTRGLSHTHELTVANLRPVEAAAADQPQTLKGRTKEAHRHRHDVQA